jgi:hypothetical protein
VLDIKSDAAGVNHHSSPFGIAGPRLIERGYCALRVPRGLKHPNIKDWRETYTHRKPTQKEIDEWSASGAGVGIITGSASSDVIGIDIDTDEPAIVAAILAVLPTNGTIVKKRGQKGQTTFGRCPGLTDKAFNINGARVCDVLANRFCVLPGTVHPDTHQPYRWLTDDTLEDTDPSDLPEYPADIVERIAAALAPFGYVVEPARAPLEPAHASSSSDPWKRLNDIAIANLDKWIPQLNLYNCKRERDGSYKAVAVWRQSSTGQPIEKRKRNLSISHRGIMDFGGGPQGYSSIDLVMAAQRCDFDSAYDWLEKLVDPSDIVIELRPKLPKIESSHTQSATILDFPTEGNAAVKPKPANDDGFSWDNPDLHYLNDGRTEPPLFPLGTLPTFWYDWCSAHAAARHTPVDYTACTLLASTAGLILNRRSARPTPEWSEPTILWLATVGDPADGKTPGMQPVISLLNEIERTLQHEAQPLLKEYQQALKRYKAQHDDWETKVLLAIKAEDNNLPPEPEPPAAVVKPRVIVTDTTTEGLVRQLSMHPKGLLQYRDELSGWLGNMNRYSGGGGDRQFWIEAYQGGVYNVDRARTVNPVTIPQLSVGVMGGIQPDVLATILKGANDGFMSRFLWTWPNFVPGFSIVSKAVPSARQQEALRRIFELEMYGVEWDPCPRSILFSDGAQKIFEEFVIRNKLRKSFGLMKGSIGKGAAHVVRLSMVLSLLDWAHRATMHEPNLIEAEYVAAAIELVEGYFYPMAKRAFHEAAMPEVDAKARKLIQWVRNEGLQTFNATVVRRAIGGDFKQDAKVMVAACDCLTDAHLIRPKPSRQGGGPGRMARDFEANPRIWEGEA